MNKVFQKLIPQYHNFILIGGPGAGKSELGINLALFLAQTETNVHFFDLDQTKPLFRSRNMAEVMERAGIHVHAQEQFQDIPSMVPGIIESLGDKSRFTFLDVGGGVHGALMAGQLSQAINTSDTFVFYAINVYRPWSSTSKGISKTCDEIMDACHALNIHIVGNPTLGPTTTADEVIRGDQLLDTLLSGKAETEYLCVDQRLLPLVEQHVNKTIIPIQPYICMTP
ncbi:MAG: hypothetical protein II882_00800 [Lachnospiraceae bacterium]|nr:hypothetical protein [Lachnospiraceae bacterium]